MKRVLASLVVVSALALAGCTGTHVDEPTLSPEQAAAQSQTTLLSVLCAGERFGADMQSFATAEFTPDSFAALRSRAAEGSALLNSSAGVLRQPPTPWPAGTETDVEDVAAYYEFGAGLLNTLATTSDGTEILAAVGSAGEVPDPTEAYGRLAASVGLGADIPAQCAERGL